MNSLLGDTLINKNGESFNTSQTLSDKIVGLYFSAHWCPPCRGYTPSLAKTYLKITQDLQKPFEIVFVSSDRDEESFKEYLNEMPWLALPFSDRDKKNELSHKYGVRGIPTLVIVDGTTGETITAKGREVVTSNPEGFPWRPRSLPDIMKEMTEFRRPDGIEMAASDGCLDGKVVGFYFSAHWCPPCRQFTPRLAEVYKTLKQKKSADVNFEIVFVSSDQDEESFKEYHNSHPWLALPYSERGVKEELSSLFEVGGIPTLVIVDGDEARTVINTNARNAVTDVDGFPWHPKAVKDINEEPDSINDKPSLLALIEGCDDEEQKDVVEVLERIAKERKESEKDGDGVLFFYALDQDNVSERVRALTKLDGTPSPAGTLLMLDIPDNGGYYIGDIEEINYESVCRFLKDFKAGSLKRKQLG